MTDPFHFYDDPDEDIIEHSTDVLSDSTNSDGVTLLENLVHEQIIHCYMEKHLAGLILKVKELQERIVELENP